jgi:putative transposase
MHGIRLQANPNIQQKKTLSQWMGCARLIWNAKCEDELYMTRYARRYCPIGTYGPIDQTFSQYKSKELTPWLSDCPSQILRNSAVNWYKTYGNFIRGECGKPKRKPFKDGTGSIHLTRELFSFETCDDGNVRLFIGSKRNNIGYLGFKKHQDFLIPNSIYITKKNGKYWLSFSYGEADASLISFNRDNLRYLSSLDESYLNQYTVGIDRGVAIPVHAGTVSYDFSPNQIKNKQKQERYIKRLERQKAKKKKGSSRYKKCQRRIAKRHEKIKNIRKDFCHQSSRKIINDEHNKVIVLESLNVQNMTKKPAPKPNTRGGWDRNQAQAKAGLNKSILDKGWHQFETYIAYKSQKAGKALFKVDAKYTSQACAACEHTHPNNRKHQALFVCESCGHTDNADRNAALVIKKRAIKLILNTETVLSNKGVLDIGRGVARQTQGEKSLSAGDRESSKKKRTASKLSLIA